MKGFGTSGVDTLGSNMIEIFSGCRQKGTTSQKDEILKTNGRKSFLDNKRNKYILQELEMDVVMQKRRNKLRKLN
jgi:hypothetical protein